MSLRERLLWFAITVLLSVVVAQAAGVLSHAAGHDLADAFMAGSVAFGGSEGLLLAVLAFVLAEDRHRGRR